MLDFCKTGENLCGNTTDCIQKDNSYTCECKTRYTQEVTSSENQDVVQCQVISVSMNPEFSKIIIILIIVIPIVLLITIGIVCFIIVLLILRSKTETPETPVYINISKDNNLIKKEDENSVYEEIQTTTKV